MIAKLLYLLRISKVEAAIRLLTSVLRMGILNLLRVTLQLLKFEDLLLYLSNHIFAWGMAAEVPRASGS
jgi:hypothetical protein